MEKYNVTGMTCAACSARVERAVSGLDGVDACSVNLLTGSMTVEGSASPNAVIEAVKKAGYGASVVDNKADASAKAPQKSDKNEIKDLGVRFLVSAVVLIVLMYISMGHTMWEFPLPSYFVDNPLAVGLAQLLLAGTVMIINRRFFVSGVRAAIRLAPNMDTLVSLGSFSAFAYSTVMLFVMIGDPHSAHRQLLV